MDEENKNIATSDDDLDLFHSNGFARATGNKLGAVSTETFTKRTELNNKRNLVSDYRFSNMGNSYAAVSAKPIVPKNDQTGANVPRPPIG